jgi:hypothetical protein
MITLKSIKEKAEREFRLKLSKLTLIFLSNIRPSSILESYKIEQSEELEDFILKIVDLAFKAGQKEERKRKLNKNKIFCSCGKSWVDISKFKGVFVKGVCDYCKGLIK